MIDFATSVASTLRYDNNHTDDAMTEAMDIDEPTPAPAAPANAMAALMANAKAKGKQKEVSVDEAREGLPWYVARDMEPIFLPSRHLWHNAGKLTAGSRSTAPRTSTMSCHTRTSHRRVS